MNTPDINIVDSLFYGKDSYLSDGVQILTDMPSVSLFSLTDNYSFKLGVLLIFVAYTLIFFRFRHNVFSLTEVLKGDSYLEKFLYEQSAVKEKFVNFGLILGVLSLSVFVLKVCDMYFAESIKPAARNFSDNWLVFIVAIALLIVIVYQYVVLKAAGALTLQQNFVSKLVDLKKILFILVCIFLIPFLLVMALNDMPGMTYLIFGAGGIFILYFCLKTFILFRQQKISILFWFLYLCAIEIFPFSLFILLAVKNF